MIRTFDKGSRAKDAKGSLEYTKKVVFAFT